MTGGTPMTQETSMFQTTQWLQGLDSLEGSQPANSWCFQGSTCSTSPAVQRKNVWTHGPLFVSPIMMPVSSVVIHFPEESLNIPNYFTLGYRVISRYPIPARPNYPSTSPSKLAISLVFITLLAPYQTHRGIGGSHSLGSTQKWIAASEREGFQPVLCWKLIDP